MGMGLTMKELAEKVEKMTLGEFNKMMSRFIEKTKKMTNIQRLLDSADKYMDKSRDWNKFMNHRPTPEEIEHMDYTENGHLFDNVKKFMQSRYDANDPDMNYWHPDNDWYSGHNGDE